MPIGYATNDAYENRKLEGFTVQTFPATARREQQ
jgi:hypothetical protein